MSSVLAKAELKSALDRLASELDSAISAAEDEVNNKLKRLRKIKDALDQSSTDSVAESKTLEWYNVYDQYFFPQESES